MAFVKSEFRGSIILSSLFWGFIYFISWLFWELDCAIYFRVYSKLDWSNRFRDNWRVYFVPAFLGAKNTVGSKDGNVLMGILRDPEKADFDGSKTISFSEAVVLGVALSINNIAGGFDAGVTNLNLWLTATISGVFSFICISGFAYVGKRFLAEYLGKWATVIAGLLLIFIGIDQLL